MAKNTKDIVAAALALVAEKKAAGWTREDFAAALKEMLANGEECGLAGSLELVDKLAGEPDQLEGDGAN